MENRNSILIDFQVEPAYGFAERRAAIAMADERLPGIQRITLGGDKGYDTRDFVASCRALKITPHVARNQARAVPRSTPALRDIRVMPSANGSENASRKRSAG